MESLKSGTKAYYDLFSRLFLQQESIVHIDYFHHHDELILMNSYDENCQTYSLIQKMVPTKHTISWHRRNFCVKKSRLPREMWLENSISSLNARILKMHVSYNSNLPLRHLHRPKWKWRVRCVALHGQAWLETPPLKESPNWVDLKDQF